MSPPITRLGELADAVLDCVVAGFVTEGVGLPDRRLVAPGTSAALPFDCELLAVNLDRTFGHEGNIAGETIQALFAHPGFALRGASLTVTLVRCSPTVEGGAVYAGTVQVPSVAEEEAAAHEQLADAMVMTNALTARNALPTYCNGVAIENWTAIGPAGGFGGGILRIRVGLA